MTSGATTAWVLAIVAVGVVAYVMIQPKQQTIIGAVTEKVANVATTTASTAASGIQTVVSDPGKIFSAFGSGIGSAASGIASTVGGWF